MSRFTVYALRAIAALALVPAAHAHSQGLSLQVDTSSAAVGTVVHLTASAPAAVGSVVFFDNNARIAAVPLTGGISVLGDAHLTAGTHALTAVLGSSVSNPVAVTITPLPVTTLKLASDTPYSFAAGTAHIVLQGLPERATGTITFSEGSTTLATLPVGTTTASHYQAFGDSITAGAFVPIPTRYADLFTSTFGFTQYNNFARSAELACDLFPTEILPNGVSATQDFAPLFSLMIGTRDMEQAGPGAYEANFIACHSAALAWLAIPREYKVLPGDAGVHILSGSWSAQPLPPAAPLDATYGTLLNAGGSGAATFSLTSGGPLYLWYLIGDHLSGSFTISLDGVSTGVLYSSTPAVPIQSIVNPDSAGIALLRLPAAPGPHTITVEAVSGTVGILGVAIAPGPEAASVHPTVLVADIPNERRTDALASPATIAQYTQDAFTSAAQLQADGLDLRTISTHPYLLGDDDEFIDISDPSQFGHQHLLSAFAAGFGTSSILPYTTTTAQDTGTDVPTPTLGRHTFTATYSGDSVYAPADASTTVEAVPPSQSITSLSATSTTVSFGDSFLCTATVFPPNNGAQVQILEGSRVLANAAVSGDTAGFSIPGLSPGLHTLYASYSGDSTNAASVSTPLTIQVQKALPTLTLTSTASRLTYPASLTLVGAISPATASGTVTFSDAYTPTTPLNTQNAPPTVTNPIGQATLTNGAVQMTLNGLAPGNHVLTGTYSGDPDYLPTNGNLNEVVDLEPTATLLSGPAAAAVGSAASFTASISPADATGIITFHDSLSAQSVPVQAASGAATWAPTTFATGSHEISATYSGDSLHAPSASAPITSVVARQPATVALTVPGAPVYSGSPLTLSAAVAPATATGTVTFSDVASGPLGQVTLSSGISNLTVPAPAAGTHSFFAQYSGDLSTLDATSAIATLQVLASPAAITLNAPASVTYPAVAVVNVSVTPSPAGGLISFAEGATLLGSVALNGGSATFALPVLPAGSHRITASFAGDTMLSAASAGVSIEVTAAPTSLSATLAQPAVLAGSPVVVNLSVSTGTSAVPTGTVTLRSGSAIVGTGILANGSAGTAYTTIAVPTTGAGSYAFTALYTGDANDAASPALTLSYTVSPRIASGRLVLSSTQVPPQTPVVLSVSFTAPGTLTPTGSVTFSRGTASLATVALDSSGSATFTMPAAAIGTYNITATYTPSGVLSTSTVAPQILTVTPPLAVAFASPAISMVAASSSTAAATLTSLSGFQGTIATSCATAETFLTCTVDAPASLTTSAQAQVHISVARKMYPSFLPLSGLLLLLLARRRRFASLLFLALATVWVSSLAGCAQGGTFGDIPAGAYQVRLDATAAGTTSSDILTVNIH